MICLHPTPAQGALILKEMAVVEILVRGAITMMTVVEGLKRAGQDLAREGFIRALETLKDWRPHSTALPGAAGR